MATRVYTARQQLKDRRIVHYVESNRLDIENPYIDLTKKIFFLEKGMQYDSLRISGDEFKPIRKCKPERINGAVRDAYHNSKRRLETKMVQEEFNFGGENDGVQ